MPGNDIAARDSAHELRQLDPGKENHVEKEGTATCEGTAGIEWLTVEQRRNDHSSRDGNEDLTVERRFVAPVDPEFSLGAGEHLTNEGNGVIGAFRNGLALGYCGLLVCVRVDTWKYVKTMMPS